MSTKGSRKSKPAKKSRPAKAKRNLRRAKPAARGRNASSAAVAAAGVAAAAGVLLVNMIPKSLSFEEEQDSEPMITVNPNNPDHIAATAFTPDPMGGGLAPYFVSSDGGKTWVLNTVVPGGKRTSDIAIAFSGTNDKFYAGILRLDSATRRMNILRTDNFESPTTLEVIEDRQQPDQPFARPSPWPAEPTRERNGCM